MNFLHEITLEHSLWPDMVGYSPTGNSLSTRRGSSSNLRIGCYQMSLFLTLNSGKFSMVSQCCHGSSPSLPLSVCSPLDGSSLSTTSQLTSGTCITSTRPPARWGCWWLSLRSAWMDALNPMSVWQWIALISAMSPTYYMLVTMGYGPNALFRWRGDHPLLVTPRGPRRHLRTTKMMITMAMTPSMCKRSKLSSGGCLRTSPVSVC